MTQSQYFYAVDYIGQPLDSMRYLNQDQQPLSVSDGAFSNFPVFMVVVIHRGAGPLQGFVVQEAI